MSEEPKTRILVDHGVPRYKLRRLETLYADELEYRYTEFRDLLNSLPERHGASEEDIMVSSDVSAEGREVIHFDAIEALGIAVIGGEHEDGQS